MKKLMATIAVLIYFAFTCGIMINAHYCMNSFDSVRLYSAKSDYCTKCGMHTENHGCCHDEVTIVKLDNDQQTSYFHFELAAPDAIPPIYSEFLPEDLHNKRQQVDFFNHSPPLLTEQDTYLQNCVFRI
jgi:hypothetical protein